MDIRGSGEDIENQPEERKPEITRKERARLRKRRRGVLRVKMTLALLLIGFIAYSGSIAYLGPTLRGPIERTASSVFKTEISIGGLHINPFTLSASATGIKIRDVRDPSFDAFQADEIAFSVDPLQLLRARLVVNYMTVSAPRLRVERGEDGAFNIEDFSPGAIEEREEKPTVAERISDRAKEAARGRDWISEIDRLLKTLEEWQRRREQLPPLPTRQVRPVRRGRRVEFPALRREPRVHIRLIEIDGVRIELADRIAGEEFPALVNGRIAMSDFAASQRLAPKPLVVSISFGVENEPDAQLSATYALDLSGPSPRSVFDIQASNLPLGRLAAISQLTLPVEFETGAASFRSSFVLDGLSLAGNIHAACLDIMTTAVAGDRVVGLRPDEFARVLNTIGWLELEFSVYGPLYALSTDLPSALGAFLESHGVRIASEYLQRRAQAEIDRRLETERDKLEEKYGIRFPAIELPPIIRPGVEPAPGEPDRPPETDIERQIEQIAEDAFRRLLERGIR